MKSRINLPIYLNEKKLLGIGVELGVLKGRLSQHILENWKGEKLYCVDSWRTFNNRIDFNNKLPPEQLEHMSETFKRLYNFGDRVCIIRDLSINAAKLFKDESLDFIYIDAGHDYQSVIQDLNMWYSKIKTGGLICGDDYVDGLYMFGDDKTTATMFEVKKAVDDFAKSLGITVNYSQNDGDEFPQWWFHK